MEPVPVRLGALADDGIAPSVYVLVERGMARRPMLAHQVRGTVELCFAEEIAAVRIVFAAHEVLVEDVGAQTAARGGESPLPADVTIRGRLPDIIHLTTAPTVAGLPSPMTRRGRSALGRLARGHVRVEGDRALARRLLALMAIE